jgi:hypothetical protein
MRKSWNLSHSSKAISVKISEITAQASLFQLSTLGLAQGHISKPGCLATTSQGEQLRLLISLIS